MGGRQHRRRAQVMASPTPSVDVDRTRTDAAVDEQIRLVVEPHLHCRGPWRWSPIEISTTSIRDFCAAVEDANPCYWDDAQAKAFRFGRLIAPPQSLLSLCMKPSWEPPYLRHDGDPEDPSGESDPEDSIRTALAALGYGTATAVRRTETYLAPFGPGDGRIRQAVTCTAVSPLKRTKVGPGVFVTSTIDYRVERDDVAIARAELVILRYAGGSATS